MKNLIEGDEEKKTHDSTRTNTHTPAQICPNFSALGEFVNLQRSVAQSDQVQQLFKSG